MSSADAVKIAEERTARWRAMEHQGISRSEIARREGVSRERVRQVLGTRPKKKRREEHRLYIDPDMYEKFEDVAKSLGVVHHDGEYAGQGFGSRLIEYIGAGRFKVS